MHQQISFINLDEWIPDNILSLNEKISCKYGTDFFKIIHGIKIHKYKKNIKVTVAIFTKYSGNQISQILNLHKKYPNFPNFFNYFHNNNIQVFYVSKWEKIYENMKSLYYKTDVFLYECVYLECLYKCFHFDPENNNIYHILLHCRNDFLTIPLDSAKKKMTATFGINERNVYAYVTSKFNSKNSKNSKNSINSSNQINQSNSY